MLMVDQSMLIVDESLMSPIHVSFFEVAQGALKGCETLQTCSAVAVGKWVIALVQSMV